MHLRLHFKLFMCAVWLRYLYALDFTSQNHTISDTTQACCYDHVQLQILSGYSGRIAALQLNSSCSQLLWSWSHRYASANYDPWSSLYPVLTTLAPLPCLDVSSLCSRYILHLVSFSPDLVYFHWSWLYFHWTWPSTFSGYPSSTF